MAVATGTSAPSSADSRTRARRRHGGFISLKNPITWGLVHEHLRNPSQKIATGFPTLDAAAGGGLDKGEQLVIAGITGAGKTLVAHTIAWKAVAEGYVVGIVSLEMAWEQLALRSLAQVGQLDAAKLRTGGYAGDLEAVKEATGKIRGLPGETFVDATNPTTVDALDGRLDAMAELEVELVIVDYLQLLRARGRENRVQELEEVSARLKQAALRHKLSTIAIAQLNREAYASRRRPHMGQIYGAGGIERDADKVLILDHTTVEEVCADVFKFGTRLEKNRHGPGCEFSVRFDKRTLSMTELAIDGPR